MVWECWPLNLRLTPESLKTEKKEAGAQNAPILKMPHVSYLEPGPGMEL